MKMKNSVDLDQLAALDLHRFQKSNGAQGAY